MRKLSIFVAVAIAAQAHAQTSNSQSAAVIPSPLLVAQPLQQAGIVLPANSEIMLSLNDTITTKGNRWKEGDTFELTVTHNVMLGGYVIIPRGSRGIGRITWLTSKGAFGKSGKMEIDLEYVEVSGRRIPISGHYRQEGEGNTVATIGGVIVASVFAGLITGKSGVIPQGRELLARTKEDLPVAISGPLPSSVAAPITVSAPPTAAPLVIAAPPTAPSATPSRPVGQIRSSRVKCATCQ